MKKLEVKLGDLSSPAKQPLKKKVVDVLHLQELCVVNFYSVFLNF